VRTILRFLPLVCVLLLALPVFAGSGNNQPQGISVTTGTSNVDCVGNNLTINEARFNWTTVTAADSMVWISQNNACGGTCPASAPALDFDRQVYDSNKVTNHCVTVGDLEPSFSSSSQVNYAYAVGGCTTSSGGVPCSRTDGNLSIGNYPTTQDYFVMPNAPAGTFSFTPVMTGPKNVYRQTGMNLPVSIIWNGGTYVQGTNYMTLTAISIDGQSCLPGAYLGAPCGTTGISLAMLCTGTAELLDPVKDNYEVHLWTTGTYVNDYNCPGHYVGEPGVELRIVPSATAGVGVTHFVTATLKVLDGSQNIVAAAAPVTWLFSVKATPSFTITPPTSFPSLPGYGTYVGTAATKSTYACGVMTAGLAAGLFNNHNFSSNDTSHDPWATFNYDGNRIFKQLADFFGSASGTWQPTHNYNVGDWVTSGGFTQVVTVAGTSASHVFFSPSPGLITLDGTVTWTNAGNTSYWRDCSYKVGMQYLDWAYNIATYNTTSEWNEFPWGMYMDYLRQNDTLTENCNGSGSCVGLNHDGNQRMGANILVTGFPHFQAFTGSYTPPSNATVRNLPYSLNIALVDWLENGTTPGNQNEIKARVDLLLQTIDDMVTYNPLDGHAKSAYACCYSAPNFDIGLLATALIDYFVINKSETGNVDTRIPVELLRLADWYNSNQFNLTGTDYSSAYEPWTPYVNTNATQSLGPLNLSLWSWLGAVYGNSCTLPTSGQGCWAVHDLMFQHALDHFSYSSAKEINQVMEFFPNYTGWRLGTLTGTDSYIMPAHNAFEMSYADTLGPYEANPYPASGFPNPVATPISGGAIITWYTYEKAVSTEVQVGTTSTVPTGTFICGASTFSGTNNLWQNTCTVTGLTSGTTYYYSVGGTDAASNSVQSHFAAGDLVYRGFHVGAQLPSTYSFVAG
jgi:hypothetical protein